MELHKVFPSDTHVGAMLDVETDGFCSVKNSMTSVCITIFSLETFVVLDKIHFGFYEKPRDHIENRETMLWRKENNVDEYEKNINSLSLVNGLHLLNNILSPNNLGKTPIIFANHTDFDLGFLSALYSYLGARVPWKHSNVFDLPSIILARNKNKSDLYVKVLESLRWKGILNLHFNAVNCKHDAFYDTVLQIEVMREALME